MRFWSKGIRLFAILFITHWMVLFFFSNSVQAKSSFLFSGVDRDLSNGPEVHSIQADLDDGGVNSFWRGIQIILSDWLGGGDEPKVFKIAPAICGNGQLENGEACDGNEGVGEHQKCSDKCELILLDYCGDGINNQNEECDDGNINNGDGCSSQCELEFPEGDGIPYDVSRLPSEFPHVPLPKMPKIKSQVIVSSAEQFNQAAAHPNSRIIVEKDLWGESIISASDIEIVVADGIQMGTLLINNGVKRIRIKGGTYQEITIKAPVSFWPEYKIYSAWVVEDVTLENVEVNSEAYYAFFGTARRLAVLNSIFRSESATFASESPEGITGENYIISGNRFYSRGPLANVLLSGANQVVFTDNLLVDNNGFNTINLQLNASNGASYIARNKFVGTGIIISSSKAWLEANYFYHERGVLFDIDPGTTALTVNRNKVFSDIADCLVCKKNSANWVDSDNSIYHYQTPALDKDIFAPLKLYIMPQDVPELSHKKTDSMLLGRERNVLRPFFIGHSLLNEFIPRMIDDIAGSLGKDNYYVYEQTYLTSLGASLRWNYNHPYDGQGADPFVELVKPNKFDALVITDAIPEANFEEETKKYATLFYKLALLGNPEADLFLLSTWLHKDKSSLEAWSASLDHEGKVWERVRDYIAGETGHQNIYIIPGGYALRRLVWEAEKGTVPGIDSADGIFEDDMIHLNSLGNYFMALVDVACLYRTPPLNATRITYKPWGELNQPLPSQAMAKRMQEIAWEAVSEYPYAGIDVSQVNTLCGNKIVESGESCDDGNQQDGDGCSANCQSELGAAQEPQAECGNGIVEVREECDDGNFIEGDGCSPACLLEDASRFASVCGNGKIEPGENCDDGNGFDGDGCSSACRTEYRVSSGSSNICGNGLVETGEACDDGNIMDGDGCTSSCLVEEPRRHKAALGLNLNWNYDYIQQWMFADAMKHARPWGTRGARGWQGWNTELNGEIQWRSDGYPVEIPFETSQGPQIVFTMMLYNHELAESTWPEGEYTVYYEGEGELAFGGDASLLRQSKGRYDIYVQPRSYVELQIIRSQRDNPIRNIQVIMPGCKNSVRSNPFHPLFLERLGNVAALRFANFMDTESNGSDGFEKRVTPNYFSQGTGKGVALEYLVQLANITKKDPWFNLPYAADDEYVEKYAQYLRDQLDPSLKIYIEYSNEIWNDAYSQSTWLREKGCQDSDTFIPSNGSEDSGIQGCDDFASGIRASAKRIARIFSIFDEVFEGQSQRLIKVMGGNTSSNEYNNWLWVLFNDSKFNPTATKANAFAIAPLFGSSQYLDDIFANEGEEALTVEAILDLAANDIKTTVANWLDYYGAWTRARNLRLLAYEAGNYLTYTSGGAELAQKVENASQSPRMGDLYSEYFERWEQAGGDLMMIYSYVGLPGVGDTRGILEYQNQPLDQAYMYQMVISANGARRPPAVCGDGVAEAWESCDDGNQVDRDGCSRYCVAE